HLARAGRIVDCHLAERAGTVIRELAEAQERIGLMPGRASFPGAVHVNRGSGSLGVLEPADDTQHLSRRFRVRERAGTPDDAGAALRSMSSIAAAAARAACVPKATIARGAA